MVARQSGDGALDEVLSLNIFRPGRVRKKSARSVGGLPSANLLHRPQT